MNPKIDEFGHDPAIRMMRRVFAQMESKQKEIIAETGISPFDPRLRRWREAARVLFEKGWAKATQKNLRLAEEEAGILYGFALKRLMERDGIAMPETVPAGERDEMLIKIKELVP
jgi:hypothetical protein